MGEDKRTLYVLVDYTDRTGEHARGDSVEYAVSDRESSELIRRGVLSKRPVRREAGHTPRRSKKGDSE